MSEVVFGSHLDLDSNEIRNARLLNLTSGTAPGTPADGDVWTTTSGIYARINGATVGPLLGSTVWGTVTGTLSDQTDLQSALDLKAPLASPTFTGTVSLSTLTADTINGRDPDDLVAGPASATDNALVRFDGTGKTVQNSGITVDDSGNVTSNLTVTGATTLTGDLTISKASATQTITSSSGVSSLSLNTVAGTAGAIRFRTGTSQRWVIQKNGTAESGSNAGSDLEIVSLTDAGGTLSTPLTITRSTGTTTLTGDLTISKAGAVITASSTTGNTDVIINGVAGNAMSLRLRTAGNNRWTIQKDTATESGSNVGADFKIWRYTDAGAVIDAPLTITRSTGAITLTGTLNGKVVNDLITGPASATDNALVRFDGTTGKVVQNSGITVDDSGNITSDVTIGKADATLTVGSGSGGGIHVVKGAAGQSRQVRMLTGTSRRWDLGANTTAEGGSSAGSDFVLTSHSDGGTQTAVVLATRSTGKVTLGAVGATAGLELGSLGPRVMSGTGSPAGVVTAPVGSQWTDTAATTGAIRWIKASGTGNTGWVVESGDTGWRNLAAVSMSNSWAVAGSTFGLRRIGQSVSIRAAFSAASASAGTLYTLPSGFRPIGNEQWYAPDAASAGRRCYIGSDGTITVVSYAATTYFVSVTYSTTDAWPSSLPGT